MESLKPITKKEVAYEYLKSSILRTELKPGQKIVIKKISNDLNISDIPIREALNKLQSEGLVDIEPHVGFRIAAVNDKVIIDRLEIKYELEIIAIRKVAKFITPEGLKQAKEKFALLEELNQNGESFKYFKEIREYYLSLYEFCGNDKLQSMIRELFNSTESLGTIFAIVPDWGNYSVKIHKEILRCIEDRDGEKAAIRMRDIKFVGLEKVLKGLAEENISITQPERWMEKVKKTDNETSSRTK